MSRVSIYEYVGGEPAFLRLAQALHERCLADAMLNHPFGRPGLRADHIERLGRYLAEAFGGPRLYSGAYGDETFVQEVHACNEPHEEMYERFLDCFTLAIEDAQFPDDDELRGSMLASMEQALTAMKRYAPAGSAVPSGLPMPQWSWRTDTA
jgi:hemoglobin